MNNLIAALLILLVCLLVFRLWRNHKRRMALLDAPLSPTHIEILQSRMPIFARLPGEERRRLEGLINRFLHDVKFHGGENFDVTEEMRVVIAAQACLLVVNKPARWYKTLQTIIVYPGAFKSSQTRFEGGVELEQENARIGESWDKGPVVLSWDHAAYGAFIDKDGHNVVMHEFAHQLDDQTGVSDGSPMLDPGHSATQWAQAFRDSYARLVNDVKAGRKSILDPYGATSPAEFFAVATETFFEKPEILAEKEPAIYAELSKYYRLDPARW